MQLQVTSSPMEAGDHGTFVCQPIVKGYIYMHACVDLRRLHYIHMQEDTYDVDPSPILICSSAEPLLEVRVCVFRSIINGMVLHVCFWVRVDAGYS